MGVPRLFSWVRRHFNNAVDYFEQGSKYYSVDYLYLDANPLLYSAKAKVEMSNGSFYPNGCLSHEQRLELIMEYFCQELVQLTDIVRPTRVLYIAIDGVAPQAKQVQQRSRRYIAPSTESAISTTNFSPGTKFMNDLTQYINLFIRREMMRNQMWRDIKVVFSNPNIPGEGEHKILQYIRNMPKKLRTDPDIKHCIYGPDGDLVMLTLSSYLDNIYLFKPDQYSTGFYYFVNMGLVRKNLPQTMNIEYRHQYAKSNDDFYDDVINDFVLLGFFVGNDFLPRLQMFIYLEDGLNMMIEHYSKFTNMGRDKSKLLTIDGKIHLAGFSSLVESLAVTEPGTLVTQMEKIEKQNYGDDTTDEIKDKLKNNTLLKYISESRNPNNRGTIKALDMNGYRQAYYAKSGIDINDQFKLDEMCRDYLITMEFVFQYYTDKLPSWTHMYKWYYPPLMTDFSKYLNKLTIAKYKEEILLPLSIETTPPSVYIQLLSILPPKAMNLLPKQYRNVYKHPKINELYPMTVKDIEIDYEGKLKEHEGVVKLPFINRDELETVTKNIKTDLLVPDLLVLKFEGSASVNFKNKYGVLNNINIRRIVKK